MMKMRTLILICCMLASGWQHAAAQRKIHERRALAPDASVRVVFQNGEVRVFGWDRDSIAVIGGVHETRSSRFAFNVTDDGRGAKLGIWAEEEDDSPASVLHIYVPHRSSVWVKTTGANISTRQDGALELIAVTGSINVSGSPRVLTAETMAGHIDLQTSVGTARVKTASGNISIAGAASDISATTVTGNITAALDKYARARFESVDGQLRYFGAIPPAAELDFSNHAGPIMLQIPGNTAAEFAFNLYEAELTDDFGMRKRWQSSGKTKARELTFSMGDRPSARVTIRSFKGPVSIRKEPATVK